MKLYIGETIKRLRQDKGLTQEQLAEKLGVSFQSVSRWEGGTSYPDIELIPEIAGFFHVTTDELMGLDKSLLNKKLEESLKLLEGDIPLEKRLEIQRQIHKDFPHDSGVLYGLIHTLGELCEEGKERKYYAELKRLAEEFLALPDITPYCRDQVRTELITAAPDEETQEMLDRYADVFDMRTGALLKKRYEYRNEPERCEAQKQANLIDAVDDFAFDLPKGSDAEETAGFQIKALRVLNVLADQKEDDVIPPVPDLWCRARVHLGLGLAATLCSIPGKEDAALDILERTITLTENAFLLSENAAIPVDAKGFADISICVSFSPPTRFCNFRHPVFIYKMRGHEFRKDHIGLRVNALNRAEFDPIREHPRFLACAERVRKMT